MRISRCGPPDLGGCLTVASVLKCDPVNLERLLSGATPDPSEPELSPDAVSRLRLTQAVRRAQYAIAWERGWPHLARLLTVAGLFLVVSWSGLWLALPFLARAIGFGLPAPIWPALAIALMTIGVNLIVDWILSINARPSGASAEM